MGGSSPPFIYDPPDRYHFDGPIDRGFNPKAATRASWTPRQRPPKKKEGPLVNFYRHPDSYSKFPYGKTNVQPMSPKTKNRVIYGRYIQLFLRVCALVGALGALFCVICIKNTTTAVGWIIRVAPAVAILHTVYGIYHLCRRATGRTPSSSASYMLFASTVDAGLIPFYVFTAFVAHGQYTKDYYHWDTLFENSEATYQISYATFLVTVVNGGFHLISLFLSIYLAVIFRQIARLPPDMNPLEDNLTSRSHKRNKSELTEKHLSQSTLASSTNRMSAAEDPLIAPPRKVPFLHTRADSSSSISDQVSAAKSNEERAPTTPEHSQRLSRADLPSQQMLLYQQANRSSSSLARSVARKTRESPSRPTSSAMHEAPVIEPSVAVAEETRNWSPSSSLLKDNWFTYPSESPSPSPPPVNEPVNENIARRESSSVYSRATSTATSAYSGMKDWLTSAQRYGQDYSNVITEDTHGEYTSLDDHEYYGHEDTYDQPRVEIYNDAEQDLGERKLSISSFSEDECRVNPLGLNPPTPQPPPHEPTKRDSLRRIALTDIPNPSVYAGDLVPPPLKSPDSEGRFYGDLESRTGLTTERKISDFGATRNQSKKKFGSKKFSRRQSRKSVTYESVKTDEDDTGAPSELKMNKRGSKDNESDRKGRVVSNSGVDIGAGFQLGSGSPSSYGNYIAGLGVGRRRDVSGKVAEEGRGGSSYSDFERTPEKPANTPPAGARAAGWARFAGL